MTKRSEELLPAQRALSGLTEERRSVPVLAAVSGGLDSMCLLHFLTEWGSSHGFSVTCAHFHHGLRAAADRDLMFVRDWCAARGIPFVSGRGDARQAARDRGMTVEEAARDLRYSFLQKTAQERGCRWIFTAHHAGDQAETVLLNLIRGTGLTGLCGIPRQRDRVFRPFLEISRETLAEYARRHGVPHVEDESNADPDAAARNLLRLQVMPLLRQLNPRAAEHICRTAAVLRETEEDVRRAAQAYLSAVGGSPEHPELPVAELRQLSSAAQDQALLLALERTGGRKDVGAVHLEMLHRLMDRGGHCSLPHGVSAVCREGRLTLCRTVPAQAAVLRAETPTYWNGWRLRLTRTPAAPGLALCEAAAAQEISVGRAQPNGRLTLPETHGGARTVKRLCLDRRISVEERDRLPGIYVNGQLAAVWRLGVDMDFQPEGEALWFIEIQQQTEENEHGK